MIAVILLGLAIIAIMLLGWVIYYLVSELGEMRRDLEVAQMSEHAKCVAHIADMTSKRVVALAFRDAAHRYNTVEGQTELQRIVRENWMQGGPSVPSLWMLAQADRLDDESDG